MKFSTRTTYGLRAMVILAKNHKKGSVSLSKIAKDENLSLRYLERLFSALKEGRLVKSLKGASGGYSLMKSPGNIDVYDIINALEGKESPFHCLAAGGKVYCGNKCECKAIPVFAKIEQAMAVAMKNIKLSDLI